MFPVTRNEAPVESEGIFGVPYYCHESFMDLVSFDVLQDPVFIHGYQLSRVTAETLLDKEQAHPFTRKRIARAHITPPTARYMYIYSEYIRRRNALIRASEKSQLKFMLATELE